jgi:hypothetical protein
MLWFQGWNEAKADAKLSLKTWKMLNPTYTVRALNGTEADLLTNRSALIPNRIWNPLTFQAKSDIYRTLLLHRYGGIWADASLAAVVPLDSWLDDQSDLFSFLRHDSPQKMKKKDINPWVTSWFLASPPRGYMVGEIVKIITNPDEFYRFKRDYYWWHRIVSDLARNNEKFGRRITTAFPSADPMHGRVPRFGDRAPMFKRFAHKTVKLLVQGAERCCFGIQAIHNNHTLTECQRWDCSFLGANWGKVSSSDQSR